MGRRARVERERSSGRPTGAAGRELRRKLAANGANAIFEAPAHYDQKISDALVELVQPLLERFGDVTKARFEDLLKIAVVVWNGDALPGGEKYLEEARRLLEGGANPDASRGLFEFLLDRRRSLFSHDTRLVAQVVVSEGAGPGDFKVSAAYADPRPV